MCSESLPLRKCGLKSVRKLQVDGKGRVTSLAEVWIEIDSYKRVLQHFPSLPLRKCGLKWK